MIVGCTGHRPERVGGYDASSTAALVRVARTYLNETRPTRVMSGMALGWDQAVVIACIELEIPFVAAVPYIGHGSNWPEHSRERYRRLLSKAERVEPVSRHGYTKYVLNKRNEWIVDNVEHMVALWDGEMRGGTWNCLKYAASVGRPVTNLWPQWEALVSQ